MRPVLGVLVLSTLGCGSGDDMLPVGGVPTDGGSIIRPDSSGGPKDAPTDAGSDGSVATVDANIFTGRVCLANDPRKLNACASTGAGGLTVRLGSAIATTSDNGSFMIEGQSATVWRVTGANIVSSYMLLGDYEIPAIPRTIYDAMISNNLKGLQLNPGEGAIMLQIIDNGLGYSGVSGASAPASSWQAFYDGADQTPTTFQQTATGFNGMMWIPGIDVGSATVTVTDTSDTTTKGPLPVFDGGITFATVIFPP